MGCHSNANFYEHEDIFWLDIKEAFEKGSDYAYSKYLGKKTIIRDEKYVKAHLFELKLKNSRFGKKVKFYFDLKTLKLT
jgi:hypothetical protein